MSVDIAALFVRFVYIFMNGVTSPPAKRRRVQNCAVYFKTFNHCAAVIFHPNFIFWERIVNLIFGILESKNVKATDFMAFSCLAGIFSADFEMFMEMLVSHFHSPDFLGRDKSN